MLIMSIYRHYRFFDTGDLSVLNISTNLFIFYHQQNVISHEFFWLINFASSIATINYNAVMIDKWWLFLFVLMLCQVLFHLGMGLHFAFLDLVVLSSWATFLANILKNCDRRSRLLYIHFCYNSYCGVGKNMISP